MLSSKAQLISDADIQAVIQTLQSDWLTTGPKVHDFEQAFAAFAGARDAVAVSNGTAALHAAMAAIEINPGDEVIVPTMTFAATANAVVYRRGTPVFIDVDVESLLINPECIAEKITSRTKAIVAVDYAGHPCDYDVLREIADKHNLYLIADACHAVGGSYKGRKVGSLADLNTFSFHPVKNMTTCEGGMITTNNAEWAKTMRLFRNHGINSDHHQRAKNGTWYYEMLDLGFNYRLTDIQCALGLSQLQRLPEWTLRRQEIARRYDTAFTKTDFIKPLAVRPRVSHAYHLYVVRLDVGRFGLNRNDIFNQLRLAAIPVNVHYVPVHLHPFYRHTFGTTIGLCPVAEAAFQQILSLPVYPAMTDADVDFVIESLIRFIP